MKKLFAIILLATGFLFASSEVDFISNGDDVNYPQAGEDDIL